MVKVVVNGFWRLAPFSGWVVAATILLGGWVSIHSRLTAVETKLGTIGSMVEKLVPWPEYDARMKAVEREVDRLTRLP